MFHCKNDTEAVLIQRIGENSILRFNKDPNKPRFEITSEPELSLNVDDEEVKEIYGVFGLLELDSPFLLLITEASSVCRTAGEIMKVDDVELLKLTSGFEPSSNHDFNVLSMMRAVFEEHKFYFSFGCDITHTQQRLKAKSPLPSDIRFQWNAHMLEMFNEVKGIEDFIAPVINGFVEEKETELMDNKFRFCFISRRSCLRQGTRFNKRGCDDEGNVANFVETEQIMYHPNGGFSSFVQVRGSIPLVWSQYVSMKYMPVCDVEEDFEKNQEVFAKHMTSLADHYGPVCCVNLIDYHTKKGPQGDQRILGEAFGLHSEKFNDNDERVKYVWFDFHHECRKMQWHNLSKLASQIMDDVQTGGCLEVSPTGEVLSRQNGVCRTNCMDNLDRTNVVQSMIGRWGVLNHFKLPCHRDGLYSGDEIFEDVFNNMWADNADEMSRLYSGTDAQKTDFTRTGRRTKKGALKDLKNSVKRYFLNNFFDGRRQDCIDVFLGIGDTKSIPEKSGTHPLAKFLFSWFGTFLSVAMIISLGLSEEHTMTKRAFTGAAVASAVCVGLLRFISKNTTAIGKAFVDKPAVANKKN
eukprot:TRINITY_DN5882_c0_g1_i1.p1 TRINITY_DN5882_c0_g1~~TRINITY_DN5882_c0_g1_i1.p1  ORF type:complete len:591 (+),score=173.82 TRINITY_DN5882_c0_g1_i1:37-1773(+)